MPFLAPLIAPLIGGGFITKLLVGTALVIGGTLLSNALNPPKAAAQRVTRDPGVSLSLQVGGNSPLSFIVGLSATKGHRVYAGSWGNDGETPNAFFADVIELANAPVDGLNGVYAEGERCTILWDEAHADYGYPIYEGRRDGQDYLWVKFYRGDQTTADAYLRAKFGAHSTRPYDADMVGRGTSYAIVTTRYNRQNWNGRPPSILFEVRGLRCYDIRKDSTAGGSGAHRRNDASTWEWSKNPYVIAFNTAFMGVYVGTEWLWGLQGLLPSRLPTSAWVAAMNESDRTLEGWEGAQFEIGGEITVDMEPATVLESIAKASLGKFIESAGSYKPRCGLPGASVWSFGEGELLITEPRVHTPFVGLEATHNAVEITYSEPAEAWGPKPAPEATDPAMIAADGNRKLPAGLSLGMVNRNEQAQRLAWSYLRDGRRFRTLSGSFHPLSWALEPGDVIDGTILAEGYDGKDFEIIEMSGRRTFVQTMTIREVDPDDFDPPESAYQEWSVGPIQTIYPPSQPATGISFAEYTFFDNTANARRPGIEGFYQGGMDDVQYFAVQVRKAGEELPFFESDTTPYRADVIGEASQQFYSQAFTPKLNVEVRGRYVPFTSRKTDWSSWTALTIPNVKLGADDIDLKFSELSGEASALINSMKVNLRDILDRIEQQGTLLSEQDLVNFNQAKSLVRKIEASTAENKAGYLEAIDVATGPNSAIAQKFETLYVAMGGNTAQINVQWDAEAGPSGYDVQYGITLAVDDGIYRAASLWGQVSNDPGQPTRWLFDADQIVFTSDGGLTVAALFESGTTFIRNARIQNLNADNIATGWITADYIDAGKLDAAEILQAGTLLTDVIAAEAITKTFANESSSTTTLPAGTLGGSNPTTTVLTLTTSDVSMGGMILTGLISFSFSALAISTQTVSVQVLRNGVGVGFASLTSGIPAGAGHVNYFATLPLSWYDPTPGTNPTYTVVVTSLQVESGLAEVWDRRLSAINTKR